MDFIAALLIYAQSQDISRSEMTLRHAIYCQNLYFQPNSELKMKKAACDYAQIEYEIAYVKAGKY